MGLERFMLKDQYISQHLCAVSTEERAPSYTSPYSSSPATEAMQTDQYHLSSPERQHHIQRKLCLYCGEDGHLVQTCPVRPLHPTVSSNHVNLVVNYPQYHGAVTNRSFPVKIILDSGSSGNFLSSHLLSTFNIPCQRSPTCYQIMTIQGKPLGNGLVWWKTPELTLRIGCFHEESWCWRNPPLMLSRGRPWMAKYQPNIRWISGGIDQWHDYCFQHCL